MDRVRKTDDDKTKTDDDKTCAYCDSKRCVDVGSKSASAVGHSGPQPVLQSVFMEVGPELSVTARSAAQKPAPALESNVAVPLKK
jgi:hypothetical protein